MPDARSAFIISFEPMEKPALAKGTRDFGPASMAKRQLIIDSARSVFQQFGFLPLETPAMENLATLQGKYGDEGDALLFRILNSGDFLQGVDSAALASQNSRAVTAAIAEKGLRYDLTVPFARFVVMNRNEISLPFKRFQIQPVWRADRPQKGRYREFYQCDADVVGTDSLLCEAEILMMITAVFQKLGIADYTIKINHRDVLNGLAEVAGAADKAAPLFVAIDKLEKIGVEKVQAELVEKGFTESSLGQVFSLLALKGDVPAKASQLKSAFGSNTSGLKGITEVGEILELVRHYGLETKNIEWDLSLARGLSYYTGCIFEVKINHVAIGSVCGGGRYDNLTQAFGSKERLSGVGISFGIDRIFDAMEELGLFPEKSTRSTQILICHFDAATLQYGLPILSKLRAAGIASELYPDVSKLKKQLDYANKKEISFVIVIGSEEMQQGLLTWKNMESGVQEKLTIEQIIARF
jgi:histidyl-tRNA synthetase